jgi:hypothetical protein
MIARTKIIGGAFQFFCILACVLIIAMLAIILGNIITNGVGSVTFEFLTQAPAMGMAEGGIFPAIFGTFALVVLMTIAVIPLGVATAIYMHEYASKRSRVVHLVRLAIQNLAGVRAGNRPGALWRKSRIWTARNHLGFPDAGSFDNAHGSSGNRGGSACDSSELQRGCLFVGCDALANDPAGGASAGSRGNSYGGHPGRQPRIRRGRPGYVYGSGLFFAGVAEELERSVHGTWISRLCDDDAVTGCGGDQAYTVCDGSCSAFVNIHAEFQRNYDTGSDP